MKHRLPTKEQQRALKALYYRDAKTVMTMPFLKFRHTAFWEFGGNALMVPWCGMIIGIEPDGYTHS